MEKTDIKIGTNFRYGSSIYTIKSISPTSEILKDSKDYILHDYLGYCGGITGINEKGFQFYAVIMGDLFQKDILFKDCEIIK